jgi:hypothetical protein
MGVGVRSGRRPDHPLEPAGSKASQTMAQPVQAAESKASRTTVGPEGAARNQAHRTTPERRQSAVVGIRASRTEGAAGQAAAPGTAAQVGELPACIRSRVRPSGRRHTQTRERYPAEERMPSARCPTRFPAEEAAGHTAAAAVVQGRRAVQGEEPVPGTVPAQGTAPVLSLRNRLPEGLADPAVPAAAEDLRRPSCAA